MPVARDRYNSVLAIRWRAAHPELTAWLQAYEGTDSFLISLREALASWGSLTTNQAMAARRNMLEQQRLAQARLSALLPEGADVPVENRVHPATADEVPHIFNGTYTMDDGTEHMTFQVYTVIRGRLAGKRIVKRMLAYGDYAGFAFVGSDGSLMVWRRFAEAAEANERYIVWARLLMECLSAPTRSTTPGHDSLQFGEYTIQRSRSCRRCNRELTVPTSIEAGIGPECARRATERTTAADHHEVVAGSPERDRLETAVSEYRANATASNATALRRATVQLLLSELGTGEVR